MNSFGDSTPRMVRLAILLICSGPVAIWISPMIGLAPSKTCLVWVALVLTLMPQILTLDHPFPARFSLDHLRRDGPMVYGLAVTIAVLAWTPDTGGAETLRVFLICTAVLACCAVVAGRGTTWKAPLRRVRIRVDAAGFIVIPLAFVAIDVMRSVKTSQGTLNALLSLLALAAVLEGLSPRSAPDHGFFRRAISLTAQIFALPFGMLLLLNLLARPDHFDIAPAMAVFLLGLAISILLRELVTQWRASKRSR